MNLSPLLSVPRPSILAIIVLNVVQINDSNSFRLQTGIELGMKPKLAGHVITCHTWISTSRIALGTKSGRIVIIEEADVVTYIPLDVNDPRASRIAFHNER